MINSHFGKFQTMILRELERVESLTRKHVPATPPCKGLILWCPKSQGEPQPLGCTNFVSNAHITMFILFKIFMAKCILITFLYQSGKHSSKQAIMVYSQYINYQNDSDKYEMIMACSQRINHEYKNECIMRMMNMQMT